MRVLSIRILGLAMIGLLPSLGWTLDLNEHDALAIGQKIWKNECNGTLAGLTSWNTGENFASLGICHFIWYPAGEKKVFEESFPALLHFFKENRVFISAALERQSSCPWKDRATFLAATQDPQNALMTELKTLLERTIALQARFAVLRLEKALPLMLSKTDASRRKSVETQFNRMLQVRNGPYALIDYVNFKGEGIKETERYKGFGWGLLQVLEEMSGTAPSTAPNDFANAAEKVLRRRVENSPPERHEDRWLLGWLNRVKTYRGVNP